MGPAWHPLQYHRSGVYGYGAESGGVVGGAEETLVGLGSFFFFFFMGNSGSCGGADDGLGVGQDCGDSDGTIGQTGGVEWVGGVSGE